MFFQNICCQLAGKNTTQSFASLSGVSYFTCPPERGIFAPLYKVSLLPAKFCIFKNFQVELDEPDDVPMMSTSQLRKSEDVSSFDPFFALFNKFKGLTKLPCGFPKNRSMFFASRSLFPLPVAVIFLQQQVLFSWGSRESFTRSLSVSLACLKLC